MIISLKELKERCDAKDIDWIQSLQVKRRLKTLISNQDLPEQVASFLWKLRDFRWELARNQILPEDIIKFVIKNFKNTREISKAIYSQTLTKQILTKEMIEFIFEFTRGKDDKQYYSTWQIIPTKMKEYIHPDTVFMNCLVRGNFANGFFITTIVKMCASDPSILSDFIDYVEKNNLKEIFTYANFLESFCCSIFFDDNNLGRLTKLLEPIAFQAMAKYIVSRNRCSESYKTILVLSM